MTSSCIFVISWATRATASLDKSTISSVLVASFEAVRSVVWISDSLL